MAVHFDQPRTHLSAKQMAQYLDGAGWPADKLVTGVAIGFAESGGDTGADNGIAAGFMQVNYRAHHQWDAAQLKDPSTCADASVSILHSEGEKAWVTFTSGAYKAFIPAARKGVHDAGVDPNKGPLSGNSGISDTIDAPFKAFSSVTDFLTELAQSIFSRDFWWRVFKIITGMFIVAFAVKILLNSAGISTPTPIPVPV